MYCDERSQASLDEKFSFFLRSMKLLKRNSYVENELPKTMQQSALLTERILRRLDPRYGGTSFDESLMHIGVVRELIHCR